MNTDERQVMMAGMIRYLLWIFLCVSAVPWFIGCDNGQAASEGSKVRLALNWKPEPQFGGFYAALADDIYRDEGLQVDILPGGAGRPTIQMLGAGSTEFGIVSADEVVIARARGNDVVALFAVYQDCPQGLMTHADRGFETIGAIFAHPGTVAMERGLPYARMLQKQYGFEKVKVVPSPGGDITQFLTDPTFTQQCFITSEPLAAEKRGVQTKTFLVRETGYNPYTTVLATSGKFLQEHPETVAAMVRAVRRGWERYLEDPSAANMLMRSLRPDIDEQTMIDSAAAQKPLITPEGMPVGMMTEERWQTLIDQLTELGDIQEPVKASECFVWLP